MQINYEFCDFLLVSAPSGPPVGIAVTALDSRSINITWSPPTSDTINGVVRQYIINVTVSETLEMFEYITSNTYLYLTGLHPHYTYVTVVSAFTVAQGPYSLQKSVTTPQDGKTDHDCMYHA